MNFELSKDIGIAIKIGEQYFPLRKGIKKIRKISEPYTMRTFFVGENTARTEILGVKKFLRIKGDAVSDDTANKFICGLYGKSGEECQTKVILFDRKTLNGDTCEGTEADVVIAMKSNEAEGAPEDGCFTEFECDIYINSGGTNGSFKIAEV